MAASLWRVFTLVCYICTHVQTLGVGWLCIFTVQVNGSAQADSHIPNYFSAELGQACLLRGCLSTPRSASPQEPAACIHFKVQPQNCLQTQWPSLLIEVKWKQNDPRLITCSVLPRFAALPGKKIWKYNMHIILRPSPLRLNLFWHCFYLFGGVSFNDEDNVLTLSSLREISYL